MSLKYDLLEKNILISFFFFFLFQIRGMELTDLKGPDTRSG